MTSAKLHLTFFPAVVCEDIRIENTGKQFLIGVYPRDILVVAFPATIALSLWLPFDAEGSGELPLKVQVLGPGDTMLVKMELTGQLSASGKSAINTPQMPIQVQAAGALKFQIQQFEEPWETVATIDVNLAPQNTPIS